VFDILYPSLSNSVDDLFNLQKVTLLLLFFIPYYFYNLLLLLLLLFYYFYFIIIITIIKIYVIAFTLRMMRMKR